MKVLLALVAIAITAAAIALLRDPQPPLPDGVPREFSGQVRAIVDGDTLRMARARPGLSTDPGAGASTAPERRVRLDSADAPEGSQRCGQVDCGADARRQLAALVDAQVAPCPPTLQGICASASATLSCTTTGFDAKWDRIVARCGTHRVSDLAAAMVGNGFARAMGFHGRRSPYEALERDARAARRGYWATGAFDDPSRYRAAH